MTVVSFRAAEPLVGALTDAASRAGTTISEAARSALAATLIRPRPAYGDGSQHSFVHDSYAALTSDGRDPDAFGRLTTFRQQLADGTAWAAFTLGTPDLPAAIPPSYSPLAAVSDDDRPLWNLTTKHTISSPQPFTCAGVATSSGLTGAHAEGVNPSAGTIGFGGDVVSPVIRSGLFDATREIVDSSNPSIDSIVLDEMREGFNRDVEQLVADELATATPAGTTAAATIAADVRKSIAEMVGNRRRRAGAAVISAAATLADAAAVGFDEVTGDVMAQWRSQGVGINLSADLGAASTGEVVAVVVAPASLYGWGTGPTTFRFEQVNGPALVRLGVYGYAAVKIVRPVGVRVHTHS